ncbi:MAG: hypothetical protein HFG02_09420 [Oscillibacter sp.]|nr:hypothetical protein [Oscillibacter sp.]
MKLSLVIMAAGLGVRYGGNKQVDGIGPHREILMEYSIHDALRAGFDKVVFIIKPEMREMMEKLVGSYLTQKTALDGSPLELRYVYQDFSSIPGFYAIPKGRTRPFGTVHALLCAEEVVGEPCCVINADDFYGLSAYQAMARELARLPEEGQAAMVGYRLKNTASLHGTVTRGICALRDGFLESVQETRNIQLYADGTLRDVEADRPLDPDAVVSMNFWGFMPSIFPVLRQYFEGFLRRAGDDPRAECLLPDMVDRYLQEGKLRVSVLPSGGQWFGMTYQEDREAVAQSLRRLHEQREYPASLRD